MGRIQAHRTPAVHTWCGLEGGLPLFIELPRALILGNRASDGLCTGRSVVGMVVSGVEDDG
jgi:hypothetical protein